MPEAADLNLVLEKNHLKAVRVTSLAEVTLPKPEVVYELAVRGLG